MKTHLSILITLLVSIQFATAQKIDTSISNSPTCTYCIFMEKHKTNNSIGWLLLAPGTTMFAVGGIINATHSDNIFTAGLNSKGAKVGLAGSLMALTSIPFFISAGNNRKMAFLSLKKEKLSLLEKGPGKFSYPAIAVKIIL